VEEFMARVPAVKAEQLEKRYQTPDGESVHAVRGIDLQIEQGEIYAILGPNGAGKTTTISMLTTLLEPTAGQASIVGFDIVRQPAEVRRHIGVTFQEIVLDVELTGRQALDFHGRLYGMSKSERQAKIAELAALVELEDVLDRHIKSYSGGMKRRLELARGLMTSPEVLVLDEPTQGLDPQNRVGIWRYIRALRDEHGITLLLSTHYMDEAEALADRVGIIDHGQLIVEGEPKALIRAMGADIVHLTGQGNVEDFTAELTGLHYVSQVDSHALADSHRLQIGVDNGDQRLADVITRASKCDFLVQEASVAKPSLGDVFMAKTGNALRD
jgi:ABC-2 type transport system ATP-binding protein